MISVSVLTSGTDTDAGADATTASISPATNKQLLLIVGANRGSLPNTPTVTGAGLTWTAVATVAFASNTFRLTLFKAIGTPTPGALTIDFAAQAQTRISWSVLEITGSNTTDSVVQSATSSGSSGDTKTVSLASALGGDTNFVVAYWMTTGNAITTGTGYAEIEQLDYANQNLQTAWSTLRLTTATATMSASWGVIAVEISSPETLVHGDTKNLRPLTTSPRPIRTDR